MHASIYHAVMEWKNLPALDLFERLETLKPGLFSDLLDLGFGEDDAKYALMYIAYAYSKESDLIVMGEQDNAHKMKVAGFVDLPVRLQGPVVMMQNPIVRDVVLGYLDAQSDRKWKQLCLDKELYDAMMDSGVKSMRKEDGSVDFKGMNESAKNRRELHAEIEKLESEFRQEYGFVIENREEINKLKATAKSGQLLNIEHSRLIS